MTKKEVIYKLKELNIDSNNYHVIGGAALVLLDIIEETTDIDLSCSKEMYDLLDWDIKLGYFGTEIKYFDVFEIGTCFYDMNRVEQIEGFFVSNLEATYECKKKENKKQDKKIVEKLEYLLCEKNDFYWFEKKLRENNITMIAGVDEVGRGPLVGPVVAACVVLPKQFQLKGLTDSKKLSEKKREYFYDEIMKQALGVGLGIISEKIIDEVNIYEATKMAMKEAIEDCKKKVSIDHVLIDAMPLDLGIPTTSIIKGDLKSITVSAASVVAKVTRDRMLYELDLKYPMYDFKENKGYPTKKHLAAIGEYGIIDEHRRSYGPVKEYLQRVSE